MTKPLGSKFSDLDFHEFGIQILRDVLVKDEYEIIELHRNSLLLPNIVCKKEGKKYFIAVRSAEVHNMPILDEPSRMLLMDLAKDKKAVAAFASVGIGSTNSTRFDNRLALKNDAFYANYTGLEIIKDFTS